MEQELQKNLEAYNTILISIQEFLVNYSFQVLGAVIIFILGLFISSRLSRMVVELLEKRDVDITLRTYAGHVVRFVILFCFIVIALGKFGITIAPFVAALGALTVVAGLALQGLVSNYAAGVSIIATRPFKVGDTLTVIGSSGVVKEINLAMTIIETEDLEEITVPNKHIVGEVLLNTFSYRLVETSIGVAYDSDPESVSSIILASLLELDFVAKKPSPQVGIDEFADSAIVIGVRCWVPTTSYMENRYKINQTIFTAITNENITIPYPHLDVLQREV